MTLSDLWPRFQGHNIFDLEYQKHKLVFIEAKDDGGFDDSWTTGA